MRDALSGALAALAAGLVLLGPAGSVAEAPAPLASLLQDPAEQQQVIRGAAAAAVMQQEPCATAGYAVEKKLVIYRQPVFDAGGKATSGAWKQIVDEEGCGARHALNVIVVAQPSGELAVLPLLPGSTHADPVLQKDAVGFVVQAAATVPGGRAPDCQRRYIADTEFVEQETETLPGAKGPSWRERWTFVSCAQRLQIPVHFIPDATGTTISAGPNTAIQVLPTEPPRG